MVAMEMRVSEMLHDLNEEDLKMVISYIQFLSDLRKKGNTEINLTHLTESEQTDLEERKKAFAEMEKFRKNAGLYFPKDLDYDKVREEAIEEKYGRFN